MHWNAADNGCILEPHACQWSYRLAIYACIIELIFLHCLQPTTLAAQSASTPYDTTLALNADGSNALLSATPQQILVKDPSTSYTNITMTVKALPAGATATGGSNSAITYCTGTDGLLAHADPKPASYICHASDILNLHMCRHL